MAILDEQTWQDAGSGAAAAMLSAGQRRRLGLARLLVTGRPLWVLDEPTVSLDAGSVALFAGAVRAHLAAQKFEATGYAYAILPGEKAMTGAW